MLKIRGIPLISKAEERKLPSISNINDIMGFIINKVDSFNNSSPSLSTLENCHNLYNPNTILYFKDPNVTPQYRTSQNTESIYGYLVCKKNNSNSYLLHNNHGYTDSIIEAIESSEHIYHNMYNSELNQAHKNITCISNKFLDRRIEEITINRKLREAASRITIHNTSILPEITNSLYVMLKYKNYLKYRDIEEIDKEIELRKKQYPSSKIFLLVNRQVHDALRVLCNSEKFYKGCHILTDIDPGYNFAKQLNIDGYSSAIFTREQVKLNYRVNICYGLSRQKRKWTLAWWKAWQFDIKVEDRKDIDKKIIKVIPRYRNLEV